MNNTLVEAEIWTMARTDRGSAILIRPIGSERAVPIFIGQLEAQSILVGMSNINLPRPITHDLFLDMLKNLSITVERIEINRLTGATFYAQIIVRQGKKKYTFDSRPSDAIAVAIRVKCSLYIAEYIVDQAGIPTSVISDIERVSINKSVLEELKNALKMAVEEENYEDAARIRDRIQQLEEEKAEFSDDITEGLFNLFEDILEDNLGDDEQDEDDGENF